jgi:hypothetical protein
MTGDLVFGGLSLRPYAAVYAAVGEGFPLQMVLEHAGIPPEAWAPIDEAWSDALADEAVVVAFDRALDELRATYRRPIPPLDDDLAAWIRFSRAWQAAPEPAAFLRQRGLEANDMLRLHRSWTLRLADDPALRARAATLAAEKEPAPPRVKKPAPIELRAPARRSTGTRRIQMASAPKEQPPSLMAALPTPKGEALVPARVVASAPLVEDARTTVDTRALVVDDDLPSLGGAVGDNPYDSFLLPADFELPPPESVAAVSLSDQMSLAQYAAYRAELDAFPDRAEDIYRKYGLAAPERRERIDAGWLERLQGETETYAEWRQLYRHFRGHWEAAAGA